MADPATKSDIMLEVEVAIDRIILLQVESDRKSRIIQSSIDKLNDVRAKNGEIFDPAGDICTPAACLAIIARLEEKATNA